MNIMDKEVFEKIGTTKAYAEYLRKCKMIKIKLKRNREYIQKLERDLTNVSIDRNLANIRLKDAQEEIERLKDFIRSVGEEVPEDES